MKALCIAMLGAVAAFADCYDARAEGALTPSLLSNRAGSPATVRIAAANSSEGDRAAADFVCTGTNDEAVLNRAIELLVKGGTVKLADGDYYVDAFSKENNSAVLFGYNEGRARTVNLEGGTENKSYNTRFGVGIHVTARAFAAMDTNKTYRVFTGTRHRPKAAGDFFTYTHVNNVNFSNFYLFLHDASKPVIGIDGFGFGNMYLHQIGIYTERYFKDRFLHEKPATPVRGSVGVASVHGSNDEMSRIGYDYVNVGGLHTGFLFQGVDHLVMKSCSAARCCYGYRTIRHAAKTLTMLNCCDEGNTHLPYFGGAGHLTAIDFNIERFNAAYIPDSPDDTGAYAAEETPGSWHGFISYTLQGGAFGLKKFWKNGHGVNFRTENLNHSRTERPKHPEYLETYFDRRTNKTLTWNGEIWVDAMGNPADGAVGGESWQLAIYGATPAGIAAAVNYLEGDIGAVDFRAPVLVPAPVEMSYVSNVAVRLDKSVAFEVTCPGHGAVAWTREKANAWFGIKDAIVKVIDGVGFDGPEEGYSLTAAPGRIAIGAKTMQGVRYAFNTLRQAAEPIPEGREVCGWWLPKLEVRDAPKLKFRGIHVCCFPETTPAFLERMIRIAAYYKFNHAVVESWGMFKSERLPFLSRRESWLTAAEARRLAALGRELGITLVPQFNVFGHATGSTYGSAKHATLDFSPERSPLFEPLGGWNWCLTNPETCKVQIEYLSEMHEAFLRPPFVHIGCDEANEPSCARCRAAGPYPMLFAKHVMAIAAAMRERGARTMMWHDMLLDRKDGRWRGFYANGTREIADVLRTAFPKDVVVCDWYYGKVPKGGDYPTLRHFRDLGFNVLTCPWRDGDGVAAQGRFAAEAGIYGMLATTWNGLSGRAFADAMERLAAAAWGTEPPKPFVPKFGEPGVPGPFATHWRQCGWDMGLPDYADTGHSPRQLSR